MYQKESSVISSEDLQKYMASPYSTNLGVKSVIRKWSCFVVRIYSTAFITWIIASAASFTISVIKQYLSFIIKPSMFFFQRWELSLCAPGSQWYMYWLVVLASWAPRTWSWLLQAWSFTFPLRWWSLPWDWASPPACGGSCAPTSNYRWFVLLKF